MGLILIGLSLRRLEISTNNVKVSLSVYFVYPRTQNIDFFAPFFILTIDSTTPFWCCEFEPMKIHSNCFSEPKDANSS